MIFKKRAGAGMRNRNHPSDPHLDLDGGTGLLELDGCSCDVVPDSGRVSYILRPRNMYLSSCPTRTRIVDVESSVPRADFNSFFFFFCLKNIGLLSYLHLFYIIITYQCRKKYLFRRIDRLINYVIDGNQIIKDFFN